MDKKRYITNGNKTLEALCNTCKYCTMRTENYKYKTCSLLHKSVKANANICEKYKMSNVFEKSGYFLLRKAD